MSLIRVIHGLKTSTSSDAPSRKMKTPLFACFAALLSMCALAETPLASITLEPGSYHVEPPGSSMAGCRSVEFSARLASTAPHLEDEMNGRRASANHAMDAPAE